MNIKLHQIRYFTAVAEALNFRRAAEVLNIAQPALTRCIHKLEEEIGARLFERTTRKVALTHAGQVFLEGSQEVLKSLEHAVDRVQMSLDGESGHLVLGYTDFAIHGELPEIVKEFRSQYPDVSVEPRHGFTSTQLTDIQNGTIDFGFVTGPIRRPGFDVLNIRNDLFVVILPETHHLAAKSQISLKDLISEPFILGNEKGWEHFHDHLYRIFRAHGFEPQVVQRAFNIEGIFGLIACGMGVTIQLQCLENQVRKGLIIRPLLESNEAVPTITLWNKGSITPVKTNFINFLKIYMALKSKNRREPF
jgi:DNA-binding transcriptional LysR family regulator